MIEAEESSEPRCAMCESGQISTRQENLDYQYGQPGPGQAMFQIEVPVRHCNKCSFEYTDEVAEGIIDRFVKNWLASNPYQCPKCAWKGAKPLRVKFGVVECPKCNTEIVMERAP